VRESERIVDEILRSPVVVAKVRSILRKHANSSPKVVQRACSILKERSIILNKQLEEDSDTEDSSSSQSQSQSQSDILSIAPSETLSDRVSEPDTSSSKVLDKVDIASFRLLEKHIRPMEVDIEDGHVKSVRIEV